MPTEPVEKEPFDFERAQQETKELVEQRRIADEERKAKAAEERKAKAEADEERKAKAEADEERKAKAAEKKLDPRIEGMAERYEKEKKPNPAKKKT
jgi:colicin import membrane protein